MTEENEKKFDKLIVQHTLAEHKPLPYLQKVRNHFKARTKTWNWFKEENNRKKQVEEYRTELLKNTYRLDKDSHQELYDICADVCKTLAIDAEVTLYQENNSLQLNAGIAIFEKEAHIVLSGNILNLLSDNEFKALIGHELSHYLFYKIDNEEYEITQRIILALANDPRSEDAIIETARIYQLYMELFCDMGAYKACDNYQIAIQALVKINTGLQEVSADSYIKQAEEIVKSDTSATTNGSHPESYIRSIALKLFAENASDFEEKLKMMIEGPLDLDNLDIFEQIEMQDLTKNIIQCIVKPSWMNTSAIQNLCKEYFPDFHREAGFNNIEELNKIIDKSRDSVKSYIAYMLLDFAKIDSDMESLPLGFTLEIAELLNLTTIYEKTLRKELKLTIREFKQTKETAMKDLQQINESQNESLYSE